MLKVSFTSPVFPGMWTIKKAKRSSQKQYNESRRRMAPHQFRLSKQAYKIVSNVFELDFCFTVHHQLGKVLQMNQLDATMIYWSIRSAQHVSGNILPIIRSVRLRFLQHMPREWQSNFQSTRKWQLFLCKKRMIKRVQNKLEWSIDITKRKHRWYIQTPSSIDKCSQTQLLIEFHTPTNALLRGLEL